MISPQEVADRIRRRCSEPHPWDVPIVVTFLLAALFALIILIPVAI